MPINWILGHKPQHTHCQTLKGRARGLNPMQ